MWLSALALPAAQPAEAAASGWGDEGAAAAALSGVAAPESGSASWANVPPSSHSHTCAGACLL